uniref:Uncharacterized protein LOC116943782 n=1 Tax=Petromyzon marinus TaxID=7757 RepID=A0AAJ7T8P8_PETMA|nr:uncharacterized protein LOC116943782 [Petromyzon marinus]
MERVIAYASRTLSGAELNYCVTRQELYAMIFACKQFRLYLYGRKCRVRTDHYALQFLLTFKEPRGQMALWLTQLQEYNLQIEYRAGRTHANADALSRRPAVCAKTRTEEACPCFTGGCCRQVAGLQERAETNPPPMRDCSMCHRDPGRRDPGPGGPHGGHGAHTSGPDGSLNPTRSDPGGRRLRLPGPGRRAAETDPAAGSRSGGSGSGPTGEEGRPTRTLEWFVCPVVRTEWGGTGANRSRPARVYLRSRPGATPAAKTGARTPARGP